MSRWRQFHDGLASRVARDDSSFKCEEKLDKWLDFGPSYSFKMGCSGIEKWDELNFSQVKPFVTLETIYEFKSHKISPQDVADSYVTPRIIPLLQKRMLTSTITDCHVSSQSMRNILTTAKDAAILAFSEQHSHMVSGCTPALQVWTHEGTRELLNKIQTWPKEVLSAFYCMEDWMKVLRVRRQLYEHIPERRPGARVYKRFHKGDQSQQDEPFSVELPSIRSKIYLGHSYSYLQFEGRNYLLCDDLLLGIINKTSEMFSCLLFNHIQSGLSLPANHYTSVVKFYKLIASVMTRTDIRGKTRHDLTHENKMFGFLKGMEGMGVAQIIFVEDIISGWENASLLNLMWSNLYTKGIVTKENMDDHPLGHLFASISPPQIAEIIGTVKLFGHPGIQIREGVEELHERTHADIAVNEAAVQGGIGVLIRDLFRSFYNKYKRYPVIELDDNDLDPMIRDLIIQRVPLNTSTGVRRWSVITAQQWASVKLCQNAEFDPVDNQLSLIKDKALGLTRSQIFQILVQDTGSQAHEGSWDNFAKYDDPGWVQEDHQLYQSRKRILRDRTKTWYEKQLQLDALAQESNIEPHPRLVQRSEVRRSLLAYLLSPNFNSSFRRYLQQFEDQPEWTRTVLNYLVIKLTAKELELKAMGRFFGASPPEERNRRVVQGKNVMAMMEQHYPDQLMTPDDLGIMKKLISFRYFGKIYPHHVLFQVSFDFSKWNNNMRRASIDIPAAAILDRWFNRRVFGKTMKAYENALVYLRERDYIRWWDGQHGGIEGLNQATWSLIFLGGIKHALEQAGINYQVTVKGDDVRAVIAVPEDQVIRHGGFDQMRNIIMEQIRELCQHMGWQMNPDESFVSLTVIATSKQYQVRNTWMPAASKKIMKMMSMSNLLFPTLEDLIGSIFSCAHSACSQATVVYPAYASALLVAALELLRSYSDKELSCTRLAALLMWPQVLAGPGALPLQTFFVRGENDMLSVIISLYTTILRDSDNNLLKSLLRSILYVPLDDNPDPALLLADPYAIALKVPERPSSLLKRLIREKLKGWVQNRDIASLLSKTGQKEKREFIAYLSSMTPYLGKLATSIYENSPFYLEEEILAKFMESPTVVALFSSGRMTKESSLRAYEALRKVLAAGRHRKDFWWATLSMGSVERQTTLGVPTFLWVNDIICPTRIAHEVRNNAWKKPIVGVTYPSLVTQCRFSIAGELQQTHQSWPISDITSKVAILHHQSVAQTQIHSHHYSSAPNASIWVGAQTAPKVHLASAESKYKSPSVSKVLKLILLTRVTAAMGDEIQRFLRVCLSSLTSVNLEPLLQLAPQGEAGHTAHRLNINAFSMNTMPNFRHNILQIVRITMDTNRIFAQDPRDRTINFAAIHFFTAVVSVLPLQCSQLLPENYPSEINLMLHPLNANGEAYELCPWCNNIVEDRVAIHFTGPMPYSMTRYLTFALVGCSPYDDHILNKSMAEFMETRIDTTLATQHRDVNDPMNRHDAAMNILHCMYRSAEAIRSAAISQNYYRVPQGEILNACLANLGLTGLYKVSIANLRVIPSETLYMGLVSLVWDLLIMDSVESDIEMAMHLILKTAPWNNPLAGLFDKIITAGMIDVVIEGSQVAGFLDVRLSWKAGCQLNAQRMSMEFIMAHHSMFMEWTSMNRIIPPSIPFTSMEGDQRISDYLKNRYNTAIRMIFRGINHHVGSPTVMSRFRDSIIGQLAILDMHYIRQEHGSVNIFLERVTYAEPDLINMCIRNVLMRGVAQGVDYDARGALSSMSTVCMLFLSLLSHYIPPAGWVYVEDVHVPENRLVDVLFINPIPFLVVPDSDLADTDKPEFLVLSKQFPVVFVELLMDTSRAVIQAQNIWCNHAANIWDDMSRRIPRIAQFFQRIRIITQTIVESERLLRHHGIERAEAMQENLRRLYLRRLAENPRVAQLDAAVNTMRRCRMGSQLQHQAIDNIIPGHPRDVNANLVHIRRTFGEVPTRDEYHNYRQAYVDPSEYTRCVGRNNTSLSKYIDILSNVDYSRQDIGDTNVDTLNICMADGIGGVTAFLVYRSIHSRVVYNSLKYDPGTGLPLADAAILSAPLELLDGFFPREMASRVNYKVGASGDLTKNGVRFALVRAVQQEQTPLSLITMDADIAWDQPENNYRQVLFGALQVAVSTLSDDTLCIFKTFLICESTVYDFMLFVLFNFRHVHFYRSSCTRMHSTEIFVVFQFPRNHATLITHVSQLLSGRWHYFPHPVAEQFISVFTEPLAASIRQFKENGTSNRRINLNEHYSNIRRMGGYPLRLHNLTDWLKIRFLTEPRHMCELLRDIQTAARETRERHYAYLIHIQGGNLLRATRDARGMAITGGWQNVRLEFQAVCRLIVAETCLSLIHQPSDGFPFNQIPRIIELSTIQLIQHFHETLVRGQSELVVCEDQLWRIDRRNSDNLTALMRTSMHKIIQILGCVGYINWLSHVGANPGLIFSGINAFCSSIVLRECCFNAFQERSLHLTTQNALIMGVPVNTAWLNGHPDLNLRVVERNELPGVVNRVQDIQPGLVQEDEMLEEELRLGEPEPLYE